MENIIYVIIGAIVFFSIISFVIVWVLFPEWLGISGRDSIKVLAEQNNNSTPSEEKNEDRP